MSGTLPSFTDPYYPVPPHGFGHPIVTHLIKFSSLEYFNASFIAQVHERYQTAPSQKYKDHIILQLVYSNCAQLVATLVKMRFTFQSKSKVSRMQSMVYIAWMKQASTLRKTRHSPGIIPCLWYNDPPSTQYKRWPFGASTNQAQPYTLLMAQ